MKHVTVSGPLYRALAKIAEVDQIDVDTLVNLKLTAVLKQECHERIAARGDLSTQDTPYVNQCSEEFLRSICDDQWELCWWAAGCWSMP